MSDYVFDHWSGEYPSGSRTDPTITVSMDEDRSLDAHFVRNEGDIAVDVRHANGKRATEVNSLVVYQDSWGNNVRQVDRWYTDGNDGDLVDIPQRFSDLPGGHEYTVVAYINDQGAGQSEWFSISPGETTDVQLSVDDSVYLTPTVYYNDGQTPIEGATIKIWSHEKNQNDGDESRVWRSATTNAAGQVPTPNNRLWLYPAQGGNSGYYVVEIHYDGHVVARETLDTLSTNKPEYQLTADVPVPKRTLSMTAGEGGAITVGETDQSVADTGSRTVDMGTTIEVTATSEQGYAFDHWSGDVPSGHETDQTLSLTMDGSREVTAHFRRKSGDLSISVMDTNGNRATEVNSLVLYRDGNTAEPYRVNESWSDADGDLVDIPAAFADLPAGHDYMASVYINDQYAGSTTWFTVTDQATLSKTVTVSPSVALRPRVLYADGQTPIEGATVHVYSHEFDQDDGDVTKIWRGGQTNTSGYVTVNGNEGRLWLHPVAADQQGYYVIQVKHDGQSIATKTIGTLTSERTVDIQTDEPVPTYDVDVPDADGGTVSITPDSANGGYTIGTTVTVTAQPASGHLFSHWTGEIGNTQSFDRSISLEMDQDRTIVPHFSQVETGTKVSLAETKLNTTERTTVPLRVDSVPDGLAGGTIILAVANDSVAEIVGFDSSSNIEVLSHGRDGTQYQLRVADLDDAVGTETDAVTLGSVRLRGKAPGSSAVQIVDTQLDDDNGQRLGVTRSNATVDVTEPATANLTVETNVTARTVTISADHLEAGLAGYALNATYSQPAIADATINSSFGLPAVDVRDDGTDVVLRGLDLDAHAEPGAERIVLATITLSEAPTAHPSLSIRRFESDAGTSLDYSVQKTVVGGSYLKNTDGVGPDDEEQGENLQDIDGDGIPNYADPNNDGDGWDDDVDPTLNTANTDGVGALDGLESETKADLDGDGTRNFADPDTDGDGVDDDQDPFPAVPNRKPSAAIEVSRASVTTDETITFIDRSRDAESGITSWQWKFGDGAQSTQQQPTHRYPEPGEYEVTLTVTDAAGATNATTRNVTVTNAVPDAAFSVSPTTIVPTESVTFSDQSTDSDGSIAAYEWSFGDGATSTASDPTHTYDSAGNYEVTLTVTDDDGDVDRHRWTITVGQPANQLPHGDFTSGPATPHINDPVSFTPEVSDPDGEIVAWEWEFGDGTTSTTRAPTHTYQSGGEYDVTLTATDDAGDRVSMDRTVTVVDGAPTAAFTVDPASAPPGERISFSETSSDDGSVLTYRWAFDDGTTARTRRPSHTYESPGTYEVELTVSDASGQQDTATRTLVIGSDTTEPTISEVSPGAEATFESTVTAVSITATLSDTDSGINASASTLAVDGTPVDADIDAGRLTYRVTGLTNGSDHSFTLTAVDEQGNRNTIQRTFRIASPSSGGTETAETPTPAPTQPPAGGSAQQPQQQQGNQPQLTETTPTTTLTTTRTTTATPTRTPTPTPTTQTPTQTPTPTPPATTEPTAESTESESVSTTAVATSVRPSTSPGASDATQTTAERGMPGFGLEVTFLALAGFVVLLRSRKL